jgi:NAD-dependent dihydropyrimidine dehydrogenase PreA subunit
VSKSVYRQLQEQLDLYSVGFPATDSGIELEILRQMFTESEAEMFTSLTALLETPESVASRLKKPVTKVANQLENMAQKGLLFRKRQNDSVRYSAIPFIHGLVEFQTNKMDRRMVKLLGKYIKERFNEDLAKHTKSFQRIVPVQQSVGVKHYVSTHQNARGILENENLIVVTDCACRKQTSLFGKDCGKPLEVCFMFGPMGEYYIDNGLGREAGLEEAIEILQEAQDAGLVTQPAGAKKPFGMCSCCGDCCGFLRAINKHPKPVELVFSHYLARVNGDRCSGCEICAERCQMHAVSLTDGNISKVNANRCIGCGLCVATCPEDAIELIPKFDEACLDTPLDTTDQMIRLAQKRGFENVDPSCIVSFGF